MILTRATIVSRHWSLASMIDRWFYVDRLVICHRDGVQEDLSKTLHSTATLYKRMYRCRERVHISFEHLCWAVCTYIAFKLIERLSHACLRRRLHQEWTDHKNIGNSCLLMVERQELSFIPTTIGSGNQLSSSWVTKALLWSHLAMVKNATGPPLI